MSERKEFVHSRVFGVCWIATPSISLILHVVLVQNEGAAIAFSTFMDSTGDAYRRVYGAICGTPPRLKVWHPQWLAVKDLYADLRRVLPGVRGRLLDVGCGEKPYAKWLNVEIEHLGLDVQPASGIDYVVEPRDGWPIESATIDAVLCTQTLEHVADVSVFVSEIDRVLRPAGLLILTVPFIYNFHTQEHGSDYRRFSSDGLRQLFADYEIVELKPQGGVGSTFGCLLLNWIDMSLSRTAIKRIIKGLLLPFMVPFSFAINLCGWLLDQIDHTQAFYSNVMLVARKRG